jgi:hypothetical protein
MKKPALRSLVIGLVLHHGRKLHFGSGWLNPFCHGGVGAIGANQRSGNDQRAFKVCFRG